MIYKVNARFKEASAAEFHRKLLDGKIAEQKPDGPEIVDSMNRAVVKESGEIEWSELCYRSPPLAHERQTVLDNHFDNISTEVIEAYQEPVITRAVHSWTISQSLPDSSLVFPLLRISARRGRGEDRS